jgi:chitinase
MMRLLRNNLVLTRKKTFRYPLFVTAFLCLLLSFHSFAQQKKLAVIAYYAGHNPSQLDSFSIEKLTHIIYSFCHLKGNRLNVNSALDTAIIQKMVALKSRNKDLKVILSLGGWGGCATCSDVFSTKDGRKEFASSVKELNDFFGSDGLDLDWEYPAIAGYPGHKYSDSDRVNFTLLVKELRKELGSKNEISFAAGGFSHFIDKSIEWKKVMKKVNYVNVMTYDLVSGFATKTGHHTALYSTSTQTESTDNAVQKLVAVHVPASKIVIGAAFYGRVFEHVADTNTGLYQQGRFLRSVSYSNIPIQLSPDSGFVYHWDEQANAPYLYNPAQQLFVTYDDRHSIQLKTRYAMDKKLGGIMFWQLRDDAYTEGLLDAIDEAKRTSKK